jgi:hypothetical protein
MFVVVSSQLQYATTPIGGHTASQEFRRFRKPYEKLRHYIVIIHVRDFLLLNMTELLHMCQ